MEDIAFKEGFADNVRSPHVKEEPPEDQNPLPGTGTAIKEELDIEPIALQRVNFKSTSCKPEPGEDQPSESCSSEHLHTKDVRIQTIDSSTPTTHFKQRLTQLSSKETITKKKNPPEDNIRTAGAGTMVKQEIDIAPTELKCFNKHYNLLPCKPEPGEFQPSGPLKKDFVDDNIPDSSSLNMAIAVKIEQTDVGDDVDSLYPASTVEIELEVTSGVKREMDIGPTVLQPPEVHFTPRPCKPEYVGNSPAQNTTVATTPLSNSTSEETASKSMSPHSMDQDNKPYRCSICEKTFSLKNKLQNHMLTIHTDKTQYPCYICFKYFTQHSGLKTHMLIHTGERPHCCSVCDESFVCEADLKNHTMTHAIERPHCCSVCDESFICEVDLKNHIMTHTIEGSHCCSVCDKSFVREADLKTHTMIHTGERSHCCSVCDKSFNRKCDLKIHTITHTGERPHCCSVCNKSFAYRLVLKNHIMTHTGKRPHCCSVCNKSFIRKDRLQNHMSIHTGKLPHCCSVCSKSFARKDHLQTHLMSHMRDTCAGTC